jgi:hypothetical protein
VERGDVFKGEVRKSARRIECKTYVSSLKLKRQQGRLQLGTAINLVSQISLQISPKSSDARSHFPEVS